jgi:O-acetylhomoserine (thiol)-lyase
MPRHVENTRKVVQFLSSNSSVEKVLYPELPSHPDYELCRKLLPNGAGAVFSFDIKGGRAAGKAFIESLRVFSHLANVGDAKSLVIHPATTTHYRMSDADLKQSGIGPGTVRLSVGLEDAQDLIDDLDRALKAAAKT